MLFKSVSGVAKRESCVILIHKNGVSRIQKDARILQAATCCSKNSIAASYPSSRQAGYTFPKSIVYVPREKFNFPPPSRIKSFDIRGGAL